LADIFLEENSPIDRPGQGNAPSRASGRAKRVLFLQGMMLVRAEGCFKRDIGGSRNFSEGGLMRFHASL